MQLNFKNILYQAILYLLLIFYISESSLFALKFNIYILQKFFMGNITFDKMHKIKEYWDIDCKVQSYFNKQQSLKVTKVMLSQCLKYMVTNTSPINNIQKLFKYIHPLHLYLSQQQFCIEQAETYIKHHGQTLLNSCLKVLKLYCNYLVKQTPTNITSFHFMRQSDIYLHYVFVRYILQMGTKRKSENIFVFDNLIHSQILSYFKATINWLYHLVNYRCSFIYCENQAIGPLIQSTYLLLCSFIGSEICKVFPSLLAKEKQQLFNEYLYITAYLITQIHKQGIEQKQYLMDVAAVSMQNILESCDKIQIQNLAPTYWFIDCLGMIEKPFLQEIILLYCFQIITILKQNKLKNNNNDLEEVEKTSTTEALLARLADSIILRYRTNQQALIQKYLIKIIQQSSEISLSRIYYVNILEKIRITVDNLTAYREKANKIGYSAYQKVLSFQTACKNWQFCQKRMYFSYVYHAIDEKVYTISLRILWKSMLRFNKQQQMDKTSYENQQQNNKEQVSMQLEQQSYQHKKNNMQSGQTIEAFQ